MVGLRLLVGLPAFLRARVEPCGARATVRRRLETRSADFLRLVRRAVHGPGTGPYAELLRHAGCEYGDVECLVAREGLEGALAVLFRAGVYLTLDELKGRRPVMRGGLRLEVRPARLRNPGLPRPGGQVLGQSSGSRGPRGAPVPVDLRTVAEQAVDQALLLDVRDDARAAHAVWNVPGGAALEQMLWFGRCGVRPVRWFSQLDPRAAGLPARYRWSARVACWGSRAGGVPFPPPEFVSVDAPEPIVAWMREVCRAGGVPHLWTYASAAVRVCAAAAGGAQDLRGVRFTVSGEPVTAARMAMIRQSGADAVPRYGSSECGYIASGCFRPEAPDDMHVLTDLHAVIDAGAGGTPAGLAPDTLLFSSLREDARLILLNAALGDRGVLGERRYGCPLEAVGWRTHVWDVRSDGRLTVGGMAVLDADVLRILEETLPGRFGGGATDYQLIEESDADGRPRLTLLVHPRVTVRDPDAVVAAFLDAVARGADADRVAGLLWRGQAVLRVRRQAPIVTPGGKIRHHVVRP